MIKHLRWDLFLSVLVKKKFSWHGESTKWQDYETELQTATITEPIIWTNWGSATAHLFNWFQHHHILYTYICWCIFWPSFAPYCIFKFKSSHSSLQSNYKEKTYSFCWCQLMKVCFKRSFILLKSLKSSGRTIYVNSQFPNHIITIKQLNKYKKHINLTEASGSM